MTEEDYYDGLKRMQLFAPEHPLLPAASRGYGAVNCFYLARALGDIQEQPIQETRIPEKIEHLQILRSQLYAQRAKLSNSFHDCQDDNQREAVSKQIEQLQEEKIIPIKRAIAAIKNGEPAPVIDDSPTDEKTTIQTLQELPTDPVKLNKRLLSVRSQVSNKKAIIRKMVGNPQRKAKKTLDQHEEELRILELNLAHVERAISSQGTEVE